MQTFLPYPDFAASMRVLDPSRLGNQVYREGMTILRGGWKNHPAAKMWQGHHAALAAYLWAGIVELCERGKDYRSRPWAVEVYERMQGRLSFPTWLGREDFHLSHQSNLIRKLPDHYQPLFPGVPNDIPYIWPV